METPGSWGEALWPYPDVTAVALIALQDRTMSEANPQTSWRALDAMMREAASALALGVGGILCLTLYNQDVRNGKRFCEEL